MTDPNDCNRPSPPGAGRAVDSRPLLSVAAERGIRREMSIDTMYNVVEVDDHLITAGQPTEAEIRATAAEGIDTVINLAPHDSQSALPDEPGLVRSLGMDYHYVPVAWDSPTEADFAAFASVMDGLAPEGRTLLHCAANFRVSAFYGLYAIDRLGWSVDRAEAFRAQIWSGSDYPVWERFIQSMHGRLAGPDPDA